jgi:subtilase family serine protease
VLHRSKYKLMMGGLMAAAIACTAAVASAAGSAASGNVASWVRNATLVSAAPSNRSVEIALHMSLRNSADLKKLATEVSSPSSSQYGRYLTSEQFAARFAPAAADVAAAKALLQNAGMTHIAVGPHGVYVSATATVAQLRSVFNVSQNLYSYKGKTLRANKEEPTIPAALAGKVLYIEGLDDTAALRTPFHRSETQGALRSPAVATSASTAAVTPPPVAANLPSPFCNVSFGSSALVATLSTPAGVYGAEIPWLNCAYTPQQIQEAYGANKVKYDGKGVTVAITDAYASPTLLSDSNRYAANHGLPQLKDGVNFSQIIPVGIYDVSPDEACGPYGWWEEQSLDMAAVHGMAPGANIVYVGARDCGTSLDIALFNTVYNHVADIVTSSWGSNGEAIAPGSQASYDQALMAGAAQGITVLFSTGDDGDLAAINGVASGAWPATSAWATGVGGTSLLIQNSAGGKAEYGWGNYRAYLDNAKVHGAHKVTTSGLAQTSFEGIPYDDFVFYSGAGGGISLLETQPSYQVGTVSAALSTTLNLASGFTETLPTPMRVSPDIAMDADPYTGYLFGETFTIAGDPVSDAGCTPISDTEEYCEEGIGGTSLASPLMAGVFAIMNEKRATNGQSTVGFANPLLYNTGSKGDGVTYKSAAINQIIAPTEPVSVLRGYANDLTRIRVVTINSVPFNITPAPYALEVCGLPICLGVNDVWNWTSEASASLPPTGPGYNDVTGLGVPWVPRLINQ